MSDELAVEVPLTQGKVALVAALQAWGEYAKLNFPLLVGAA